jgi:hypothetical protein
MIMGDVRTNLRLPEELYGQIKALAEQDLRSINAQMVALLRDAVAQRPAVKPTKGEEKSK